MGLRKSKSQNSLSRPRAGHTPTRPLKSHRAKSRKLRNFVLLVAVLALGGFLLKNNLAKNETSEAKQTASEAQVQPEVLPPAVDVNQLKTKLDQIIAKYPGYEVSLAYRDLYTSASLLTGNEDPYIAASVSKLLTATMYLREVQQGKYSLERSVGGASAREQLRVMIEDSDNASWVAFNKLLTNEKLSAYAREIGMEDYVPNSNYTTTFDVALLLEKLYKGQLLNAENTKLLLSFMQKASERGYIVAALPQGFTAYHKIGFLEDRLHDAVIADDGKEPFVLVIFSNTDGVYNFATGAKMFQELTRAVLDAYKN
jgi:beta-lactamase class A